jgi:hypothetical protein
MAEQTGLGTDQLVAIIETKEKPEIVLEYLEAGLPKGLRHSVIALAEVDGVFMQNVYQLEQARDTFNQKIAVEKAKAKVARSLMLKIMQDEGIPTIKDEHVTVSVIPGRERMKCVDLEKVPESFIRTKREGNIAKAKLALKETGEIPDGFEFERGDPTVAVRRK